MGKDTIGKYQELKVRALLATTYRLCIFQFENLQFDSFLLRYRDGWGQFVKSGFEFERVLDEILRLSYDEIHHFIIRTITRCHFNEMGTFNINIQNTIN